MLLICDLGGNGGMGEGGGGGFPQWLACVQKLQIDSLGRLFVPAHYGFGRSFKPRRIPDTLAILRVLVCLQKAPVLNPQVWAKYLAVTFAL